MYMEADNHNQNAKARLISPTYPGSSTMCLQFWYNMYGANVGKFNVYAKGASGTSLGAPIWTLAGNQGQDWQLAQQTIPGRGQYSVSQSVTPGCWLILGRVNPLGRPAPNVIAAQCLLTNFIGNRWRSLEKVGFLAVNLTSCRHIMIKKRSDYWERERERDEKSIAAATGRACLCKGNN